MTPKLKRFFGSGSALGLLLMLAVFVGFFQNCSGFRAPTPTANEVANSSSVGSTDPSPSPNPTPSPPPTPVQTYDPNALRSLAAKKNFVIGVGASDPTQLNDAKYAALAAQYTAIEPGNVMKMPALEPSPGVFDFSQADQVVAFAQAHGQNVTATAPIWFSAVPSWLTNGGYTGVQLEQILHDYIFTIMQHYHTKYPGVINRWSIVSEATHGKSVWNNIPGGANAYVTLAYQYARQADPTAQLCYDDYAAEGIAGVDSANVLALVTSLKAQGLIDCVGLEGQWEGNPISAIPTGPDIVANINRLGALGLDVYFSQVEIGVASSNGLTVNNLADLNTQAGEYTTLLEACLSTTACRGFFTWGLTDKYAFCWNPGWCAPLPYDMNYTPKAAFTAIQSALSGPVTKIAPSTTACQVQIPSCAAHPESAGTYYDNYQDAGYNVGAGSNQAECMKRAQDFYYYCGAGPSYIAKYFVNGVAVQSTHYP